MRPGIVLELARKEILSTLRDRRAIMSNLLLPLILLPVMMLGLPLLLGGLFSREQASETPLPVYRLAELPQEITSAFEAANISAYESSDPEEEVRNDDAPVGLVVPENFTQTVAAGERAQLGLYSKGQGNLRSEVAAGKVNAVIDGYRQRVVAETLQSAGLDPSVLEPIAVETLDASTEAERSSGMFSWIIPFFIAIWTLAGGQMTAIDATAGEKERGTLEALLVAPVKRAEVVVGKFLATLLFGLTAAAMAIVGYVAGGSLITSMVGSRLGGEGAELVEMMGGSLQVTPTSVLLLLVSTILLAATIASLLLLITMFARSFKEAQSYIAPLSFLMVLPVLALQFASLLDLGNWIYAVPIVNSLMLMDEVVKGSAEPTAIAVTWISLAIASAILLFLALRNFSREDVIFRT